MLSTIDGVPISHASLGHGPDVVLLHGWGANGDAMTSIVTALAPAFTCLTVDLPGFGASPVPPVAWDVHDYARVVAGLLAHLQIPRSHLIGHSFGGRIGIVLAAERPDLVDKMILVDSAGVRPSPSTWRRTVLALAQAGQGLLAPSAFAPVRDRLRAAVRERLGSDDYRTAGAMRDTFVKVVDEDLRHLFPRIQSPTLLVWGERDDVTPVSDARLMEATIPDAGLVVLPGAGHFSYLDAPDRFAAVVRVFLAGQAT
jgi:pimeloyl-ACP methyl ester carboxylesterase